MNESKPKTFYVLMLIALVICLVFSANAWKSSLKINQIKIDGNRIVNTNELIQLTQIQIGALLYKADLTAIQRNIMSHHYIKDAVVERNLPNSINIQIIERVPIAIMNLSEPLYLDEDGVVLPKTVSRKVFDLPMITGISASEPFVLGSTITQPDEIEALQLLAVLRTMNRPLYHNISEIQVRNGGDIVFYSAEGGVPIKMWTRGVPVEEEAKKQGVKIGVGKFPWAASGRALATGTRRNAGPRCCARRRLRPAG